jgi:hypothetical protein
MNFQSKSKSKCFRASNAGAGFGSDLAVDLLSPAAKAPVFRPPITTRNNQTARMFFFIAGNSTKIDLNCQGILNPVKKLRRIYAWSK